jgi:hypothetical protein
MGLPFCYHCHQRREMTRIGNIMRFECGNPACNELVHLISARSAQANLRRWMAENWSPHFTGSDAISQSLPSTRITIHLPGRIVRCVSLQMMQRRDLRY